MKAGAMAVLVNADGLDTGADSARFAAVLVDNHFRLVSCAVEVGVDEIDFRLHCRQIFLCPTL